MYTCELYVVYKVALKIKTLASCLLMKQTTCTKMSPDLIRVSPPPLPAVAVGLEGDGETAQRNPEALAEDSELIGARDKTRAHCTVASPWACLLITARTMQWSTGPRLKVEHACTL